MIILAIETSCDETAVSIGEVKNGKLKVLSSVVSSQMKLHARWGGVVPELAAREHLKNLPPVLDLACRKAGFRSPEQAARKFDLIGVTQGPGLIPALLMGVNFAKSLAYIWKKPLIPVNHLEGHIYSAWVKGLPKTFSFRENPFPLLALIVSGGHTMLVRVKKQLDYEILGETMDDAAGEAFDKVARILGLGYPGGPQISKLAKAGQPNFEFTQPLRGSREIKFSFSGLKTAVLYKALEISKHKKLKDILGRAPKPDLELSLNPKQKKDIAKAFEDVAVENLLRQTKKALTRYQFKTAVIGGGVAANVLLRQRWKTELNQEFLKLRVSLPPVELTGDNAAMLLPVTYLRWQHANTKKREEYRKTWQTLEANASLRLA
jgi:N6-L-threonylcarbamoyladenine synthase